MSQLRAHLEKAFGPDFFKSLSPVFREGGVGAGFWEEGARPKVDLYHTPQEVIAVIEAPGIERKEDIRLHVEPQRLLIQGVQQNRYAQIAKEQYLLSERDRGPFEREVVLPVPVVPEQVQALYRLGLLEVHMRKAHQRKEPQHPE